MEEKRITAGYEIIESCTIGTTSLSSVITPKPQPVCVLVLQGRLGLFLGILLQSVIGSEGKAE